MKMRIIFLFLASMLPVGFNYPATKTMTSIKDICECIINDSSCAPDQKLVLFDIDYTLGCCSLEFSSLPFNLPFKVLMPSKRLPIGERIHYIFKLNPMENDTVESVDQLRKNGIATLALTARPVNGAERAYQQLAEMGQTGIRFSIPNLLTINNQNLVTDIDIIFNYKDAKTNSVVEARFFKGIICCDNKDKGIVLREFLRINNLAPKKIYFIDDRNDNVTAVHEAMDTSKIDCLAMHYTAQKKSSLRCIARDTLASIAILVASYAAYYKLTH